MDRSCAHGPTCGFRAVWPMLKKNLYKNQCRSGIRNWRNYIVILNNILRRALFMKLASLVLSGCGIANG